MSQIDIGPTLLGLLNFSYVSSFYGYDLFKLEPGRERVLLGNYQKAGYLHDDTLTILEPKQVVRQSIPKFDKSGDAAALASPEPELVDEAVAYYQTASYRFGHGLMRAPLAESRRGVATRRAAATADASSQRPPGSN